jgi:hypothetical protein
MCSQMIYSSSIEKSDFSERRVSVRSVRAISSQVSVVKEEKKRRSSERM